MVLNLITTYTSLQNRNRPPGIQAVRPELGGGEGGGPGVWDERGGVRGGMLLKTKTSTDGVCGGES